MLQDRYQIQEVIGAGGMGMVYRARDTNFKAIRLVAVKEMITNITDPMVKKNIFGIFERESNLLATLRHNSIPRIYDYFIANDRAYLVMEFINGQDMDAILAEVSGNFPEDQVVAWGIELCDVLGYLHGQEPEAIIFRDMKPSNIMMTKTNHIMLIDFGIAKHFEGGQKNTMVGTQGYSPPDQYRGEATPAVDIYALGATLHHLFTMSDPRLEAPFSFHERPIQDINPNVSDEVAAVVGMALEYDPKDRYKTTAEMKEALVNAARKTGMLSADLLPLGTISRGSSSVKGVKSLWTFEAEDEIRGTPLYNSGTLYFGCYDNNLYALDASNGEFKWKYATEGGIPGKPAFHDNNIYIGSEDNRLHVISSRTGSIAWTHFTDGPIRSSPRLAQGHVFVGSDDGKLHAINITTSRLAWTFDAGAQIRSTPFVTDEFVYFGDEQGQFYCVNFTGQAKWRFKAKRAITSSPFVDGKIVYFASLDSTLYALDAGSSFAIWRFRLGKGSISSPKVSDGKVFVGAADKVIYAIDAKSAKEAWRYTTDHQITGAPTPYKDSVYCGSVDGNLYCLDLASGRLKWQFSTEGPITGSPIINEGIVYFGSMDKKIYALLA